MFMSNNDYINEVNPIDNNLKELSRVVPGTSSDDITGL